MSLITADTSTIDADAVVVTGERIFKVHSKEQIKGAGQSVKDNLIGHLMGNEENN